MFCLSLAFYVFIFTIYQSHSNFQNNRGRLGQGVTTKLEPSAKIGILLIFSRHCVCAFNSKFLKYSTN